MYLTRKKGRGLKRFCNVVRELIILHDLGFKEDDHGRWVYTIYVKTGLHKETLEAYYYKKEVVASGDYLYLIDTANDEKNVTTLWRRDAGGIIAKSTINSLLEIITAGNV